jgi:hypothetical protein
MWALSTKEIHSTAPFVVTEACAQAAAQRRQPLTTDQFVVRAHFRQRFPVNDGPRADRQGGEGVSTAFHTRPTSSPAVASGPQGRAA